MINFRVFAPCFIILNEKYLHWPELMLFAKLGQNFLDIFADTFFSSPLHIHRLLGSPNEKLGWLDFNV